MRVFGVRVWVLVGVVVLAAAGIVVLYFMYGRAPKPGDVLLQDDFSAPSSQWPAGAANGGFTSFSGGAYLVGADPQSSISALADLDSDQRDVRIEARVLAMPTAGDVLVGLACRADHADRFDELLVSPDGHWAIRAQPSGQVLGQGSFNTSLLGSGAVDLAATCTGGEEAGQPLRLELSVNGTVVGTARVPVGGSPIGAPGIGFVVSNGAFDPADIRFDDVKVTIAA